MTMMQQTLWPGSNKSKKQYHLTYSFTIYTSHQSKGDEDYPQLAESADVFLVTPDWTMPYLNFLPKELPEDDEVLSRQVEQRTKSYTIIDGQLYKRSTSGIFQRCVSSTEGREILQEIHSCEFGHHTAAKALVAKAFQHGFFWLTAKEDAADIVKTCESCQRYAK